MSQLTDNKFYGPVTRDEGAYIVMDNTPIHTADDIDEMISKKRYRSIYLPPYSPELNPIENFGSTMKFRGQEK